MPKIIEWFWLFEAFLDFFLSFFNGDVLKGRSLWEIGGGLGVLLIITGFCLGKKFFLNKNF